MIGILAHYNRDTHYVSKNARIRDSLRFEKQKVKTLTTFGYVVKDITYMFQ